MAPGIADLQTLELSFSELQPGTHLACSKDKFLCNPQTFSGNALLEACPSRSPIAPKFAFIHHCSAPTVPAP